MKLNTCQSLAIVLLSGLLFASCKDNDIVYDTDVEDKEFRSVGVSFPVGKVSIPLYATLQKELNTADPILLDENGVIYVEYTHEERVEWLNSIGINELEKKTISYEINTPSTPPPGLPGKHQYDGDRNTSVKLSTTKTDGEADPTTWVSEVEFSEGRLTFEISLPSGFDGNFRLEIPQLTLAGEQTPFLRDIQTSTASPDDYIIDLAGATIETNADADADHTINIKYSFQIGGNAPLNPNAKVEVSYEMSGLEVSSMFGYFGQLEPEDDQGEGEIDLDFFDDFELDGEFGFTDIKIDAEVVSKLGIPLSVSSEFDMYRDETKINGFVLNSPFDLSIASATQENNAVTASTNRFSSTATLNLDGSNLPNKLKFKVGGLSNPDESGNDEENFLIRGEEDESLVDVMLKVRIPFRFKTSLYSRKDTIDFDFNDMIKDNEVESECVDNVSLKLSMDNGLPLDIDLKMVALTEDGQILAEEPLIREHSIEGGALSDGNITPKHSDLIVQLTQKQIKEFRDRNVKKLILETGSKTTGNDYVTLTGESYLNIDISFTANVTISSEIF
jgi:hypothetical protein